MRLLFTLLLCSVSMIIYGQSELAKNFNSKKGVAIEGYDPVSYYQGQPKKGTPSYQTAFNGTTYYFSSESNKKLFQSDSKKYVPAYGGWCAYAMGASGDKVKIDPLTYKIHNERLYLFYNFRGTNTLELWNANEQPLRRKADEYWNKIIHPEKD